MSKAKEIQTLLGIALLNGLLFGVGTELLSDYVRQDLVFWMVVFSVIVVSYLLLFWVTKRFEKRSRNKLMLEQREYPPPRRGLIVFMSPGSRVTAAENAVKAHLAALEHCWVICGPDRAGHDPTSRGNAEKIQAAYSKNTKDEAIHYHLEFLIDEDDPRQSYFLVGSIYEQAKSFGLAEKDIIADYTGGTKSMTAGMVLSCSTSEERDTEYMKATETTPMGTPASSTQALPVLIDLTFGGPH